MKEIDFSPSFKLHKFTAILLCQSRPIDFVLPSIPPAFAALASPGAAETISLSSSESSEVPLWARLALLEPGPTLLGGLNPELYRISVETPEEEVVFPDGHVGRVWIGMQYDSAGERLPGVPHKGQEFAIQSVRMQQLLRSFRENLRTA
ncbi:uncharacterized protein CEXT_380221 [Caerostris extrusa]|uniref:Uncharacterized protein n=1 Tax=Caerostris extrusa TaxID=172846 RepID=A0AAV4XNM0_CAEEX|nr:uncharacterized protein CEXT_380221 [Caerostris extrusa]